MSNKSHYQHTFEQVKRQLHEAQAKISTRLLVVDGDATDQQQEAARNAQLSEHERRFAMHTLAVLGPAARSFEFGANHACHGEYRPPSGFQLTVDADAPLRASFFPRDTLQNGTMAFPLDASEHSSRRYKSKALATDNYLSSSKVRESLNRELCDSADLGSDETNFVGIFCSTSEHNFKRTQRLWVVVQTNDAEASAALHSMMLDAERERKSWNQFWYEDERVKLAMQRQRRHRAGVIVRAIKACGLGPPSGRKERAVNVDFVLQCASLIENKFNYTEKPAPNLVTYLSRAHSKLELTQGALLSQSPCLGVLVLRGKWDRTVGPIGLPIGTGDRLACSREHFVDNARASVRFDQLRKSRSHSWATGEHNLNLLTNEANTRRSSGWAAMERACGFAETHEALVLVPVQVKLKSRPAQQDELSQSARTHDDNERSDDSDRGDSADQ